MSNRRPNASRVRALELLAQGLSERAVQERLATEGHSVSKGSIGNWKAAAAGKAPSGEAAPAKTARANSVRAATPAAEAATASADVVGGDEWVPPAVDLVQLPAALLEQLGQLFSKRIADALAKPAVDDQELGALFKYHGLVMKALVLARPPVALDPEKDPGNLEMAGVAIGQIRRMIADARKRRVAPAPAEAAA